LDSGGEGKQRVGAQSNGEAALPGEADARKIGVSQTIIETAITGDELIAEFKIG